MIKEEMKKKINELITYIEKRIKDVDKCYDEMLTELEDGTKIINLTGLTKKEQTEIETKVNCLTVQKYCYKEILEFIKKEKINE